jgi:peptide subunit release factor 1 (eRF1)
MAQLLCPEPQPAPLRDLVWVLGRDFGAKLEFVRGEAEERLLHEFQGAAALLRW